MVPILFLDIDGALHPDDAKSEIPEDWAYLVHCDGARGITDRCVQKIVSGFLADTVKSTRQPN